VNRPPKNLFEKTPKFEHFSSNKCPNDYRTLFEGLIYFCPTDGLNRKPDFIGGQNAQPHILDHLLRSRLALAMTSMFSIWLFLLDRNSLIPLKGRGARQVCR